jgi:hypothetical protein
VHMLIPNELIELLDLPDSDVWYDNGCTLARKIIDGNCTIILDEIIRVWRSWPENRLIHLAYVLGDSTQLSELSLIHDLMSSDNRDIVFREKEALASFKNITSRSS